MKEAQRKNSSTSKGKPTGKPEKELTEEEKKKAAEEKAAEELTKKQSFLESMTKGSLLDVSGLPKGVSLHEVKAYFLKFGKVAWIDFEKEHAKARLRFREANEAKTALEKLKTGESEKIMYKEAELACSVVEGDEELKHWEQIFVSRSAHETSQRGGRGGSRGGSRGGRGNRGRRGGGGRGGGRGRGAKRFYQDSDPSNKNKKAKTEDEDDDDDDDDACAEEFAHDSD